MSSEVQLLDIISWKWVEKRTFWNYRHV